MNIKDIWKKLSSTARKLIIMDVVLAALLVLVVCIGGFRSQFKKALNNKSAALAETSETDAELNEVENQLAKTLAQKAEAEGIAAEEEAAEAARIAAEQAEADRIAAEQAEAERIAAEQAAPEVTVHLTMVGDVLLNGIVNTACVTDYGYDYNGIFQNVAPYLADYDLKIINEETACGGVEYGISGYPSFNSPHEAQDAIADAGFNVVCMASNHMLDLGTEPLYSTLNYWRSCYPGILTVGAYDSQEASDQVGIYEKDGFRIAILNYTYGSNAGGGEYYDAPFSLNILYEEEVRNDIRKAKENADYVIVCPHWGTEYLLDYDDDQYMWAQIFLEEGVDLVLGTHPHCPEPIEVYTREDGHQMICYYSLGNFVSGQEAAYSLVGGMADVTIRKTAQGVVVEDYGLVPIVTHKSYYFTTYLLKDYSNDLAWASNGVNTDPDFSWDYCAYLVTSMYGDRLRNF